MLEDLLKQVESKTLEFKESANSLRGIIQTVIAFANTAGGIIVIGVKDRTKDVIGIQNILHEEERISNAIADAIEPLITPTLQLTSWRKRNVLIIRVPYSVGPYYLKTKGIEHGTFIRFGSTNRLADKTTIETILKTKQHLYFDELPCHYTTKDDLDLSLGKELFEKVSKKFTLSQTRSLEILVSHQEHELPSYGGILLLGKHGTRTKIFPNSIIKCARFKGKSKVNFIDQVQIESPLPLAINQILDFVKKHSMVGYKIGEMKRQEVPQYPPQVVREAVINAIVHADYSIKGASIQVAIFDDRIEITNPGNLPFGLSLEKALSGFSQLRNKVIGRVFQELELIEHWGTGLNRMIEICQEQEIEPPKFEEIDNFFKVTLFHALQPPKVFEKWEQVLIDYLHAHHDISPKQAQKIWGVTARTTSSRLSKMCDKRLIAEVSTGPYDPQKTFVIARISQSSL